MVSRTQHDPESPPSMPALSLKRSAALREEEGARKRHASTDHVLGDNEALTRYLNHNQDSLADLQQKHNTLESDHNEILKAFIEFRNEVARVSHFPPSPSSVPTLTDLPLGPNIRKGYLQQDSQSSRPEKRGE